MIFIFIKKKHQTASPENLHFPTKKNRTALVFMLENKNKDSFGILERFLTKVRSVFFNFLFRFLSTKDFIWETEIIQPPI